MGYSSAELKTMGVGGRQRHYYGAKVVTVGRTAFFISILTGAVAPSFVNALCAQRKKTTMHSGWNGGESLVNRRLGRASPTCTRCYEVHFADSSLKK